jgi:hypothetical protein
MSLEHRMTTANDRREIEALLDRMYAMVSGPAGPRDWSYQYEIFHPLCRQIRTGIEKSGEVWLKIFDPGQYRDEADEHFANMSFYEVETRREILIFGNVAHVWSAYEARTDPDDDVPERRGINSIQLFRDETGWRVISMIWDNERPGLSVEDGFARAVT